MKLIGKIKRAWKAHRWYIIAIAVLIGSNIGLVFMKPHVSPELKRHITASIEMAEIIKNGIEMKYDDKYSVTDSLVGVIDARVVEGLTIIQDRLNCVLDGCDKK